MKLDPPKALQKEAHGQHKEVANEAAVAGEEHGPRRRSPEAAPDHLALPPERGWKSLRIDFDEVWQTRDQKGDVYSSKGGYPAIKIIMERILKSGRRMVKIRVSPPPTTNIHQCAEASSQERRSGMNCVIYRPTPKFCLVFPLTNHGVTPYDAHHWPCPGTGSPRRELWALGASTPVGCCIQPHHPFINLSCSKGSYIRPRPSPQNSTAGHPCWEPDFWLNRWANILHAVKYCTSRRVIFLVEGVSRGVYIITQARHGECNILKIAGKVRSSKYIPHPPSRSLMLQPLR